MKRLIFAAALLAFSPAYAADQSPTPEMRLAAEIARLNLILAHMGEQLDKQAQTISDLQVKAKAAEKPATAEDKPQ